MSNTAVSYTHLDVYKRQLFGPESSEVINLVAMAMKTGQEYTFLRDFVFTHPSMSEALNDLMGF